MKQLTIGNVTLDNCYVLGPMAGVTDLPFPFALQRAGGRADLHGNGQRERDFI